MRIIVTILLIVNGHPEMKNREGLRKLKKYSSIFSAMADINKAQAQRRNEAREPKEMKFITTGTPLYNNEKSKKYSSRTFIKTTFPPFIQKNIRPTYSNDNIPLKLNTPSHAPLRDGTRQNREKDEDEGLSMDELNILMEYMREILRSSYKKPSYASDERRNVNRFNIVNKEMREKVPGPMGSPLQDSIPGNPGEDYPTFSSIPDTSFSCGNQNFAGFYADVEASCQAFYICQEGGFVDGFLCPNGTVFNQEYFICDWWFNVNCDLAEMFFPLNEFVYNSTSIF